MTLYEVLLSVVGPVPVGDGIGGFVLWMAGCILTIITPLYAVYYVSKMFRGWSYA